MSPFRPTEPLTGLARVRRIDATRPNGDRVTFICDGIRFVETRHGRYYAEADDITTEIPADEVDRAAAQLPNLATAAIHEARKRRGDDPTWCRIAAMCQGVAA